jgi:predicted ATP-dependent endonuclease of OLD family
MHIKFVEVSNFRKLKACHIDFSEKETVFVGANNSGKTSAMDALILLLKRPHKIVTQDITLSNWKALNQIGNDWLNIKEKEEPDLSIGLWEKWLPQLDIWLQAETSEIHYVADIIPNLDWNGGALGLRLRFEPKDIEKLFKDFTSSFKAAKALSTAGKDSEKKMSLNLWPKSLWDFLERELTSHFSVRAYTLDPAGLETPVDGVAQPQLLVPENLPLASDPLKALIKIDIINAQRNFSDPNSEADEMPKSHGNLSSQLREYYVKHLDPSENPDIGDLAALEALEAARDSFDNRLKASFDSPIKELEGLNYPGFGGNPSIRLSSKVKPIDGLNHGSAVQFDLQNPGAAEGEPALSLPEKYNGLGFQNLISMVFKLMRFRDEWMQVGKSLKKVVDIKDDSEFQPLHLVLVEEPEAHLHAQVQQVFIKKAYNVLRANDKLLQRKQFHTQLVVSTHSNHIAHEIEFTSLRYFKRRDAVVGSVPTSTVVNLEMVFGEKSDTNKFAARYLRTTHCDLFFADAVILVEGPAERMLVPHFIRNHYEALDSCYVAILEINGSHAHRLRALIESLGIYTLIITDLDSVDPANNGKAVVPEKGKNYQTGNTTLKQWIPAKAPIDDLANAVTIPDKVEVAYQRPLKVRFPGDKDPVEIIPYTFEIALAIDNTTLFKSIIGTGMIKSFKAALDKPTAAEVNTALYNSLDSAKKAQFALDLLFLEDPKKLITPTYIANGLNWLQKILVK